jgi:two-component system response regulator AtoC
LVESELFGHERGAFTDAKGQKPGLLELANGGSLFLDEIAELPPGAQAKLLKVLETGVFRRVGGIVDVRVSLRFIAATHRDLRKAVQAQTFREDLFHRLDVFRIQLPPLRERPEDVPALARGFLRELSERMGKRVTALSPEAERRLAAYKYPGNVRELRNVIERAVILEQSETLTEGSILLNGEAPARAEGVWQKTLAGEGRPPTLAEVERDYLVALLTHTGGNKSLVARLMGVSFPTVARKIAEYGIELRER